MLTDKWVPKYYPSFNYRKPYWSQDFAVSFQNNAEALQKIFQPELPISNNYFSEVEKRVRPVRHPQHNLYVRFHILFCQEF